MNENKLKVYLNESLKETVTPLRIEETISLCKAQVRDYPAIRQEERTSFWGYLSDIFRYEGKSIWGLQVMALLICSLGALGEDLFNIPFWTPIFSLAVIPVIFRGQMHGMCEMEAATRASGAQIILAKLLLAGAANLVCLTIFLCLEVHLSNAYEEIGQLILYVLVPYLSCMVFMLQRVRVCRKKSVWQCVMAGVVSSAFWGLSAQLFPWLYELSAGGVWVTAFFVFGGFFVKEIWFIWEMRKEGKMYGIIN